MRLGQLFCATVFLWASAVATSDVHAQTVVGVSSVLPEKYWVVDLNGRNNDQDDMKREIVPVDADIASPTDVFSRTDLAVALKSVLNENPEIVLKALKAQPVELAELVERASYLRQIEADKEQRLEELKQPKVPAIDAERPIRGNPKASITIVEYSDFECPFCRSASTTVKEVLKQYGDDVRFVYKHNPLSFHPMAEQAARYFEAIALQDIKEAWRFHDRVFEHQDQLIDGEPALKAIVASLNIDLSKLEGDLYGESVEQRLALDIDEAEGFGFDGTPAFLVNGVSLIGSQPKEDFEEIIRMFLTQDQKDEHIAAQITQ